MKKDSEEIVLDFFKSIGFPNIRRGEGNNELCSFLQANGYRFTPDLIAGPSNIQHAKIEGLFFIDIIEPTTDLLFKSEFYEGYEVDVPKEFREIVKRNSNRKTSTYIDQLPTLHHQCYLNAVNKKLDKYAHQRKFERYGKKVCSTNFGLVHHFNLGKIEEGRLLDIKRLITLLDYIRFYKRLAPNENIDLKNAENLLLNELLNQEQINPYILSIGREWSDIPCLFYMLHISVIKKSAVRHLSLISLNISCFNRSNGSYPVHKWFIKSILHEKSKFYSNDTYKEKKITICIDSETELFS